MGLLTPHMICGVVVALISGTGVYVFVDRPLYWTFIVAVWASVTSIICWIAIIRHVEFTRACDMIAPSIPFNLIRRRPLDVLNAVFRNTLDPFFFLGVIQKARSSRGRRRVLAYAMHHELDFKVKEAKSLISKNHLTKNFGLKLHEYFTPGW